MLNCCVKFYTANSGKIYSKVSGTDNITESPDNTFVSPVNIIVSPDNIDNIISSLDTNIISG